MSEIDDLLKSLKQNIDEKEKIIEKLMGDVVALTEMLKGLYEILQTKFNVQSTYIEKLISKHYK